MAIYKEDVVNIELETGNIYRSFLSHTIGSGDALANWFGVRLFRNGEPVNVENCAVTGIFMAPDGTNYAINETSWPGSTWKSGNDASVCLPEICYAACGQFVLAIKLTGGSVTGTMRIIDGVVSDTGEDGAVVPTSTIPSTADIIAAYEEAVEVLSNCVTLTEYDAEAFISRGKFATLGYTAISQCVKPGFYMFTGTDSISDKPTDWNGGGLVKVHETDGTIWQEVIGQSQYCCRYGTSGSWYEGFTARGDINTIGFTSIGACVNSGFYTFSGNSTITDLPEGWVGGGLVIVYHNTNGARWQELVNNTQHLIRYGTSGNWYNREKLVYTKYTSGSGEDSSDAQLDVVIPKRTITSPTNIVYKMGHCVDNDNKANVWRIMYMYQETTTRRKLTISGEWECALHLDGRQDFSGGIIHGDEVDQSVIAFVDGTPTAMSALGGFCRELKIVRNSLMYDPDDHTTVIADHGVEYTFTPDGLTIKQSVKWRVAETLTACFLAMLPIIKAYSTQRFSDVDFTIETNSGSDFSVTIQKAKAVTEYNADYDIFTEMSIGEYPTGLTGGDCALITDNGGRNYNKVYFPVCTSGSCQIGDLWKSTTMFRSK